jgi:transcriptional regulator with XRE-family HTH domain
MPNDKNYLRAFRKRTDITQSDIGFLMDQPDKVSICRYEQGERKPPLEMALLYHLLFDAPIHSLFEIQKDNLNEDLIIRIGLLINELKQQSPSQRVKSRIIFLTSALNRLTA